MEPSSRAARRAATGQRILDAAQAEFGERGFDATTVRAIAARAGVDPSLVLQHYGSKQELFAVATYLDDRTSEEEVTGHLQEVLGIRLRELPPQTRALVRSMLTAPEATRMMREFLDERAANLARTSTAPDARLRAALVVSAILGLTVARHFLDLEALRDVPDAQIESVVAPWLAAALTGTSQAGTD